MGYLIATLILLCLSWFSYHIFSEQIKEYKEKEKTLNEKIVNLIIENSKLSNKYNEVIEGNKLLLFKLDSEIKNNEKVVSQSRSQSTRTGQVVENLIPLLPELPYNAKNLHHLAQPIDYLYFNYDDAEIIFVECKTGNSQESKRQKMIKNAISLGKVYYEELRIDKNGIKIKRAENKD